MDYLQEYVKYITYLLINTYTQVHTFFVKLHALWLGSSEYLLIAVAESSQFCVLQSGDCIYIYSIVSSTGIQAVRTPGKCSASLALYCHTHTSSVSVYV